MTQLDRQIRRTQHRLWLNRQIANMTTSLGVAAVGFALVVLVQRLFDFAWPVMWIGVGFGAVALVVSIIWTIVTREDASTAAARLDEAAGLKERISSGHYCADAEDPFARAVLYDAERVGGSLSVRQHIRMQVPASLTLTGGSFVLAALMFLITPGLLKSDAAQASAEQEVEAQQAKLAVKRQLDPLREITEKSPELEEFAKELEGVDRFAGGDLRKPEQIRHESLKKIDHLQDAMRQKRESAAFDKVNETKKLMRRLDVPKSDDAATKKLTKALMEGDFKSAKEEVQKIKEQLATLKSEQDKEMVEKLSKQLENLSEQLEKLAQNEKLKQELEQAGIKKEDLERMLENLSKKDLDQLKKQLEEKGMSQKKIEDVAKQLQKQQQAGSTAKQLSSAMKQGAQCKNPGQAGNAMAGLSQAADQLSELEALQQEMNQLDSAIAAADQAKNDMSNPCSGCNGSGDQGGKPCSKCNGTGSGRQGNGGMGRQPGQGRGGLAPEERTAVDFKTEKGKVHTGKGAIIGQFEFEGEQVKGDVKEDIAEVVTAAEREASDRINRDRIPRQYQKAIREYFSTVQRRVEEEKAAEKEGAKSESASPGEQPAEGETDGEGTAD